eukprot:TRINITY_DN5141_c0_g1_i1.p1 TRINITY_DN5141_c0_g1~~TRINITY_DN5141_c0_g1_i1.p1  ORF type:complete len:639 (+),score=141.13 TRINITY_DN5141_c0_g1_i1:109-2025(+)
MVTIKPMENFLKNDILSVIVLKRKVEQAKEEFEANQLKFDIVRSMVTPEKLAQYEATLADTKRTYEALSNKYSQKLGEIETRKKFEVLEKLITFTLNQYEFHKQSLQVLSEIEPLLRTQAKELEKERETFLATHVIEPEVETSNLRELARYGFLMVQDNELFDRRWVAVSNGFLYIYKDWKDANTMSSHILLSANVKRTNSASPEFIVNITTPVPTSFTFQSANTEEVDSWVNVLQNTITTLEALYKNRQHPTTPDGFIKSNLTYVSESYSQCADCGAKDPEFALLRYGALVCSSCATYHRKFAISPIKSLFENRLEPEELHILSVIGNEKLNDIFEEKIRTTKHIAKPKEDSDSSTKETYIKAKYFKNKFVQIPDVIDEEAMKQHLIDAISTNNLEKILQLVATGVNVNTIVDAKQHTSIIHRLVIEGKASLSCMEFLILNELKVDVQDVQQRTPMHYAAINDRAGYIRLFVNRGASLRTKDVEGKTAAMIVRTNSGLNAKVILASIDVDEPVKEEATEEAAVNKSDSNKDLKGSMTESTEQAKPTSSASTETTSSGAHVDEKATEEAKAVGSISSDNVPVLDGPEEQKKKLFKDILNIVQQYRPPVSEKKKLNDDEQKEKLTEIKSTVVNLSLIHI